MSTKERKKREKEQRRNAIIDAAEKVIFGKGIEHSTMDEIAHEAELSKGTLYLYFKNKNELYMAICKRGSDILNEKFSKLFSEELTGLELVGKMGEVYLRFVSENPGYFNAFMHYESMIEVEELRGSKIAELCEENLSRAMNYMVRALQVGMQDGSVDDSFDPKELSVMLWAGTRGITMMHHMREKGHHYKVIDEMEIDIGSLFDNFLTLLHKGMASEKVRQEEKND